MCRRNFHAAEHARIISISHDCNRDLEARKEFLDKNRLTIIGEAALRFTNQRIAVVDTRGDTYAHAGAFRERLHEQGKRQVHAVDFNEVCCDPERRGTHSGGLHDVLGQRLVERERHRHRIRMRAGYSQHFTDRRHLRLAAARVPALRIIEHEIRRIGEHRLKEITAATQEVWPVTHVANCSGQCIDSFPGVVFLQGVGRSARLRLEVGTQIECKTDIERLHRRGCTQPVSAGGGDDSL